MPEPIHRKAYAYDPKTHKRIPNKRDLLKELKSAIAENVSDGRVSVRYYKAMEAIRNV